MSAVLKARCYHCGKPLDLDRALEDADAIRLVELLLHLPPQVHRPLWRYLTRCHRQPTTGGTTWAKLLRLAEELTPSIESAVIERERVRYAVPAALWAEVLTGLVDTPPKDLALPLRGNGYLLSILSSKAERAAATAEQCTEDARRAGRTPGKRSGKTQTAAAAIASAKAALRNRTTTTLDVGGQPPGRIPTTPEDQK